MFFSVFSVFGVRLGTGVPAGIGRDLEHLSLNIYKTRNYLKNIKIKDMLHLPQGAQKTKLLMVLAFLGSVRVYQGLDENRKLTQLLEKLQKKNIL